MREICTSGSAGGPGGVIPWGYPTVTSLLFHFVLLFALGQLDLRTPTSKGV